MQRLQEDIDKLRCWARKCCMRFQPVKCNMMSVTRKRSKSRYQYKLEGSILSWVKSVKYLGVTISEDLCWNDHLGNTCSQAYRTLGLLIRNLPGCPPSVRETVILHSYRTPAGYKTVKVRSKRLLYVLIGLMSKFHFKIAATNSTLFENRHCSLKVESILRGKTKPDFLIKALYFYRRRNVITIH